MSYRTPMVTGDRVAIAPHHDLWMAGCRYGRITSVSDPSLTGERFYFVDLDTGRNVTLVESDLLGAVAGTPVGGDKMQALASESESDRDLRAALQGWGQ